MSKFEVTLRKDGKFQFNLKAANGEVILSSQGYSTKITCYNGILSVRNNSPKEARYDRKEAKDGRFYFNLKAVNGQVIGTSEMYESTAGRDNGIESVKKNAPGAEISDLS